MIVFKGSMTPTAKAAFTLIYILIIYILLVDKVIYKWPNLYIKA